jgi:hypothetical protein
VHDQLVAGLGAGALDGGSTAADRSLSEPDPMELAAVRNLPAVAGTAPVPGRCPSPRLLVQVAQDPRLAIAQEGVDLRLGVDPATTGRERHGDDEAVAIVDRDAQAARARRPAEAIRNGSPAEQEAPMERIGWEGRRLSHRSTS